MSAQLPRPPKLMSFDVFGTLISVRDSSYAAFEHILEDSERVASTFESFGRLGSTAI